MAPSRRPTYEGRCPAGQPPRPLYRVHPRVPAPDVLPDLARVLELDYDTLLTLAGAADVVVRESLAAHPQHTKAIIQLFRAAQQREFHDRDHLLQHIEAGRTRDSEQVRQF
jgi:hypothetical protein